MALIIAIKTRFSRKATICSLSSDVCYRECPKYFFFSFDLVSVTCQLVQVYARFDGHRLGF